MSRPTPHTAAVRCQNCHGTSFDWLRGQGDVMWTVRDIRQTDKGAYLCAICREYPGQPIKAGPYQQTDAPRRKAA